MPDNHPRRVDLSDVLELAEAMRSDADQRGPLILRESDIEALGPERAGQFWDLVRPRRQSLDS